MPEELMIGEGASGFGPVEMPQDMTITEGLSDLGSVETPEKMTIGGGTAGLNPVEMPEEMTITKELAGLNPVQMPEEPAALQNALEADSHELFGAQTVYEDTERFNGPIGSEKVMTPEEVAALLGEPAESASVLEGVQEIKTPAPDPSDPGHIMTPEEIEALLEAV